jgi:hypothetical protein
MSDTAAESIGEEIEVLDDLIEIVEEELGHMGREPQCPPCDPDEPAFGVWHGSLAAVD